RCVALDQCNTVPVHTLLPHNAATTNGTTVDHYVYTGGTNGATVELYKINGGGHVEWGGAGTTENNDFNQSAEIWRFFRDYYNPADCSVAGLEDEADASLLFRFYPNPCKDYIHIHSGVPVFTVVITDAEGKIVAGSSSKDVDVTGLEEGIYFLQLNAGG